MSQFSTISQRGAQAAQNGNMGLAEKYFREAAELQGEPPEQIFNLCRLLQIQGRNEELIDIFTQKVGKEDYPKIHPQLLLMAGQSAVGCKKNQLAIEILKTLHKRHPENSETAILLSSAEIEAGSLLDAKSILTATIKLSGKSPSLMTNLAICEAELGEIKTARTIHLEIISNNQNEFLAHYNYGKFSALTGDIDTAKASFQRCLEIVPGAPEAIEAIEQVDPKNTFLKDFFDRIDLGNDEEAAKLLKLNTNKISNANYLSCICHLRKEYRAEFGNQNHFSPKHLVRSYDLTSKNHINIDNLYKLVKESESLIKDRPGKPTVKGMQSHEILKHSKNVEIKRLCKTIRQLAEQYCKPQINPYIKSDLISESEISGWGVILNKGGHQKLHTHPESCLSGVIYLKTSSETESLSIENGNILFPSDDSLSLAPRAGLMILFPSYLPHSTIPTIEDNERACIAFNIIS